MKKIMTLLALIGALSFAVGASACVQKISPQDIVTVGPDGSVCRDRPTWGETGVGNPRGY